MAGRAVQHAIGLSMNRIVIRTDRVARTQSRALKGRLEDVREAMRDFDEAAQGALIDRRRGVDEQSAADSVTHRAFAETLARLHQQSFRVFRSPWRATCGGGVPLVVGQMAAARGAEKSTEGRQPTKPPIADIAPVTSGGTLRSNCLRASRWQSEPRIRRIWRSQQLTRGLADPRSGCDPEGSGRTLGCSEPLRSLRVCKGRRDRAATPEELPQPSP